MWATEKRMSQAARYSVVGGMLLAGLTAGGCSDSRPETELQAYSFRPTAASALATTRPAMSRPPLTARVELVPQPELPGVVTSTPSISTTRPTVGSASGQYQIVGGVVAEVNGVPIYANKVLRALRAELAAKAMELDPTQFRAFATNEITKKINGLERDELVFGAAERNLPDDDKRLAEFLTMQWRTRQVTEAGGSPEMAQRKAQADGFEFDELVFDQYRRYMTEVYYRKKVVPRITITAQTLRQYYAANLGTEFTQRAQVTFRLIKVDHRKNGGRAQALDVAGQVVDQLSRSDFAEVAKVRNDDPRLARTGGLEQPVEKGAYVFEKVEAAVWEAPIGKVIGPIEDGGAFFLARVESRTTAVVEPFDNTAVQDRIYKMLWAQQFRTLTDQIEAKLRANAMVRDSKDMFAIAIDMAMQNYQRWARGELGMQ